MYTHADVELSRRDVALPSIEIASSPRRVGVCKKYLEYIPHARSI